MQLTNEQFLSAWAFFENEARDFETSYHAQSSGPMTSCPLADTRRLAPAGLVLMTALSLTACQQEESRPPSLPTMVQVETVSLADYAPTVRLTGEIRAKVESDLSFRVAGRVSELATRDRSKKEAMDESE